MSWVRPEALMSLVVVSLAPVAVLAPLGTVVVLAIAVIVIVLSQPPAASLAAFRVPPYAALVGVLMLWSLICVWWAPSPAGAFDLWVRILGVMAGGLLLHASLDDVPEAAGERLRLAIAVLGVLLAALLLFEIVSAGLLTRLVRLGDLHPPYRHDYLARGTALLAVFAWPSAYVLWRRTGVYAALAYLAVVLGLLLYLPMFAAAVAFVAGGAVFLIARRWPAASVGVILVALLISIALAPLVLGHTGLEGWLVKVAPDLPTSWHHRLTIWQLVADLLRERPVLGWGLDASRGLPVPPDFLYKKFPLHPHNAVMQVWIELGLPGALIGAALVALVLRGIWRVRHEPAIAAIRLAAFTSFLFIALMSFGIWQNWWLASGWLAGYLTVLASGGGEAGAAAREAGA